MAWEWSHTSEACTNAANNVERLPLQTLAIIAAEWQEYDRANSTGQTSAEVFGKRYRKDISRMMRDADSERLAAYINERAQLQATCTNGGWEAWVCPYGCECHLVSFDNEGE